MHLSVPQYKPLSVDRMMEFIVHFPEAMRHLPIEVEIKNLPKQFIVNVAFKTIGDPFAKWVK